MPSLKRNRRSSTTMPPSGRAAASVMSKPPSRFSKIPPGVGPPISQPRRLPFLSVSPSAKATSVPLSLAGADQGHRLDAAIGAHPLRPRRQGHGPGRRPEPFRGEGVAGDAVPALERDIGRALPRIAVDQRHAFGVALAIVAQRLAVGAEDRAEHRIGQALEPPSVIVERGPEPSAGIGDRQQRSSRGIDGQRRIAAEMARLGIEIEPGPEDQLAELLAVRIVAVEIDGDGGDA